MAGRQTKGEKEREKVVQDRVQAVLGAMLKVRAEAGAMARAGTMCLWHIKFCMFDDGGKSCINVSRF